jgi:hypothetical protein
VGEPEEAPDAVPHRVDRGRHQPGASEESEVHLHVRALDPFERVQAIGLAPLEPPPELVGVQTVATERGPGFVTASVVDPFDNVLGIMYNRHYLEILDARPKRPEWRVGN